MQSRHSAHFVTTRSREARISAEKLTSDVADFLSNGGEIEKIGNTPFRRIKPADPAPTPPDPAAPEAK